MAYQFAHIEGYARQGSKQGKGPRKWSISDVAAEAMREPDACPHVEQPKPPTVLHGCSPDEAARQAEAWADNSRDAKGRRLRKDGLCLLAGVVSLPADRAADWPAYRAASVAWLRHQYGERLRSVVEHTDEAHPHLHFYAVPLPGERFETLHAGRLAASRAAEGGAVKGKQNEAYKRAMRHWQDDFAVQVAAPFGLSRFGPGKRRLTRAEWQQEQQQALALAKARKALDGRLPAAEIDPTTAAVLMAELHQAKAEMTETEAARDHAQKDAAKGWQTVDDIRESLQPQQWAWLVKQVQDKRKERERENGPDAGPMLGR